jgi:uncharacterized protein HemY
VLPALPSKARLAARISLALLLYDQGHREAALSEFQWAAKQPKAGPRIQRLAEKPLYFRYKDLFRPLGVGPKWLSQELHLNRAKFYLKAG